MAKKSTQKNWISSERRDLLRRNKKQFSLFLSLILLKSLTQFALSCLLHARNFRKFLDKNIFRSQTKVKFIAPCHTEWIWIKAIWQAATQLKVNNRNTRKSHEICSKLTLKKNRTTSTMCIFFNQNGRVGKLKKI